MRRLALASAGASLATLMHDCRIDSGIVRTIGAGWPPNIGGSAEMKQRKSSWPFSAQTSSRRSSAGSHDCIRCTFCRKTQPPFLE